MIEVGKDIVIIPDVHGADFWVPAVKSLPEKHLVFLGDYLDPYERDSIDDDSAYCNMLSIFDIKRQWPENVTLLWGNHDLHYIYRRLKGSRFDDWHAERNRQIFWQNYELFQIAEETTCAKGRVIFTHAGIGRKWMSAVDGQYKDICPSADSLNALMDNADFIDALGAIPFARGGWCQYGSPIWADAKESLLPDNQYGDVIQIFGHTSLKAPLSYNNRIYCLDCRALFSMSMPEGEIIKR